MEEDISEIFNNIALAENRYVEDGHKEGYAVGYSTGWDEGFVMGVQKGGQIGSEVSFYLGFINAVKTTCDEQKLTKRCEKALNSLENAVRKVSGMLNEDSNVPETIAVLRGKFRQVCSLLNISPDTTSLPDRTF